jgi:hypothetical protein
VTSRTWLPTRAQAEQAARQFFAVVPDEFEVVRARVVGETVARSLGIKWSPALSRLLRPIMESMGARAVVYEHVVLWKGLRPRHFDRAEALALSNALRRRKRPVVAVGDAA